jgi:hypothetical protein
MWTSPVKVPRTTASVRNSRQTSCKLHQLRYHARQPPSETAHRRHVNCTSPLSPWHSLWGPIRHLLRAEFLNLYGEMYPLIWELNFRYVPLSLRETLHVLLSSQSEATPNLNLGVPLCLRKTWCTHLPPSEISLRVFTVAFLCATWHQRVFLYYKRKKQTNKQTH